MSNPFGPDQNLVSRAAEKIKRFYPEVEFLEIVEQEEPEHQDEEDEVLEEQPEVLADDHIEVEAQEIEVEEPVERYQRPQRIRKPRVPYSP